MIFFSFQFWLGASGFPKAPNGAGTRFYPTPCICWAFTDFSIIARSLTILKVQKLVNTFLQWLDRCDVFGLKTLRSLYHVKLHGCALVEALVALALDRGEMYEYILAGLTADKAIALCCVKPLHGT